MDYDYDYNFKMPNKKLLINNGGNKLCQKSNSLVENKSP